jgi:hypothetical protein
MLEDEPMTDHEKTRECLLGLHTAPVLEVA